MTCYISSSPIASISVLTERIYQRPETLGLILVEAFLVHENEVVLDFRLCFVDVLAPFFEPFHTSSTSRFSSNRRKRYLSGNGFPASRYWVMSRISLSVSFIRSPVLCIISPGCLVLGEQVAMMAGAARYQADWLVLK